MPKLTCSCNEISCKVCFPDDNARREPPPVNRIERFNARLDALDTAIDAICYYVTNLPGGIGAEGAQLASNLKHEAALAYRAGRDALPPRRADDEDA